MKGSYYLISIYIVLISFLSCSSPVKEKPKELGKTLESDTVGVTLELITEGVQSPIEFKVATDGSQRVFITDTRGKIWILKGDSLQPKPFFNIYDKLGPQDPKTDVGAVFGVAFHPAFSSNGKFYVCYNAPTKVKGNMSKLVVSEFSSDKTNVDMADLGSEHRVLEVEGRDIHGNGAQIAFGPEGYLYISIGDDAIGDTNYVYTGQDLKHLNGKILRIDVNHKPYAIPADNPYVGIKGARPEIWAFGFRKMWRFCFEPGTNQLFGCDVGQEKEEEIDIVTKGGNYGWPLKEGDSIFTNTVKKGSGTLLPPINSYPRQVGICIIGGIFYNGSDIPRINGKYLFADFSGKLFTLTKTNTGRWDRQPVKIINHPEGAFLICGFGVDEKNEPIVMGFLNTKEGQKGVVYKILKA